MTDEGVKRSERGTASTTRQKRVNKQVSQCICIKSPDSNSTICLCDQDRIEHFSSCPVRSRRSRHFPQHPENRKTRADVTPPLPGYVNKQPRTGQRCTKSAHTATRVRKHETQNKLHDFPATPCHAEPTELKNKKIYLYDLFSFSPHPSSSVSLTMMYPREPRM